MKQYEITYILDPTIKEDQVSAIVEEYEKLLKDHGADVDAIEKWGMRRLAYRVQRFSEGIYVFMRMCGKPDVLSELDRRMRHSDVVIRHLIVRTDLERRRAIKLAEKRGIPNALDEKKEGDRGVDRTVGADDGVGKPAAPEQEGPKEAPAPVAVSADSDRGASRADRPDVSGAAPSEAPEAREESVAESSAGSPKSKVGSEEINDRANADGERGGQ
jgi:small subunit ribosomal protein S6